MSHSQAISLAVFATFVLVPVICTFLACSDNRLISAVSDCIMLAVHRLAMIAGPIVLVLGAYHIGAILNANGMLFPTL